MSHTYHLLCRECRTILDLGKIVNSDESDRPQPWGFAGWRDLLSGERIEGADLSSAIERFLILHRNHPLQTVSEGYLAKVDADDYTRIDSLRDLLETEPSAEPDDLLDAEEVRRRE